VKRFAELSEQEILALAISSEDEDSRIYRGFAEGLREPFPASAKVFDEMADEEVRHRTMLFDMYREKFGEYLPLIRRQDVKGFVQHKPLWLVRPLGLDEVQEQDRIVIREPPQRVVEIPEHFARLRVPAPPEIVRELVQPRESRGQRGKRDVAVHWPIHSMLENRAGKHG